MDTSVSNSSHRKIGLWSLTFISIATMIGSGWLFAAYYVAKAAGGASILAWIVGAAIIFVLALSLFELVALFPKRGAMTRFVTITHGKDTGFMFALANWLGIVAVIPTEAVATTQYLMNLSPGLVHIFYITSKHDLTWLGMLFTELLIIGYLLINYWGIKLFSRVNNLIGILKIVVPITTAIVLCVTAFHTSNFTAYHHTWVPYGGSSIFIAIISAGIIYAFNGFQAPLAFCEEVKSPKLIPLAILIALALTTGIYILLQVAFIGALPTHLIAQGWHGINFHSPLVQLSVALSLNFITLFLYVDSVISPSGTGATYMGTTGRMLCAMAQEKQMPKLFANLHPKYHFSRSAILFNVVLASLLLVVFRSWAALVTVLSIFHVISYLSGPISNSYLRKYHPNLKRPFKMPFANLLNPALFILLTLLIVFSKYPMTIEFAAIVSAFYLLYLFINSHHRPGVMLVRLKQCWYVPGYLWVVGFIDLLGPQKLGGNGFLNSIEIYFIVGLAGLIFYFIFREQGRFEISSLAQPQTTKSMQAK